MPSGRLRTRKDAPAALELCAGGGGQALGLAQAGFRHADLVELDAHSCATLTHNLHLSTPLQPRDLKEVDGSEYRGLVDVVAGGAPCPPFSIAGKQLGAGDDRDLIPWTLGIVERIRPKAFLLENVPGLAAEKFRPYRNRVVRRLQQDGYVVWCTILQASAFGVPQLRPRFVLVALQAQYAPYFAWPTPDTKPPRTVGDALFDLMAAGGWPGAKAWRHRANGIAPTVVGGSHKHGGPDLGPTRARRQWAALGVDGLGIADAPPGPDFPVDGMPRLITRMVARLQGFPDDWEFAGRKTSAYRQLGNAFPPPVARAVATCIMAALQKRPLKRPAAMSELPVEEAYLDAELAVAAGETFLR